MRIIILEGGGADSAPLDWANMVDFAQIRILYEKLGIITSLYPKYLVHQTKIVPWRPLEFWSK